MEMLEPLAYDWQKLRVAMFCDMDAATAKIAFLRRLFTVSGVFKVNLGKFLLK
jgi:hypothetical protein